MSTAPLYEDVAQRMGRLIEKQTFAPGDRLPSVRRLSREMRVSVSTVLGAYRLLEDQGQIEARPQSGYYVTAHARRPPAGTAPAAEPETAPLPPDPSPVTTSELAMRVMRDTALIPLGKAMPNPALLPTERLNRALALVARRDPALCVGYDTLPGCEPLRVQIAQRLLRAGCTLTPEQIVTTSGGQEAVSLCLRAVCRPGDTVAIESPIYYGILQAIESHGLRALEIPTHPRTGMDLDALAAALDQTRVRACVVIANFNNPLGSLMPDENKRRLVEMLAARDIPLIEDDIYGELSFDPVRPKACKAFDATGNVLLCSSFSKTLAAGYRVGWVAAGRCQARVERLKLVTNIATPMPSQLAVAEFLRSGGFDHHLRCVRRVHAQQTAQMAQAVAHFFPPGTRVTRPRGGFVLWVELAPGFDSVRFYERAVAHGISVAPGPIFSARPRYRHCVRLNTAFWSPPVEAAIETLGALAASG